MLKVLLMLYEVITVALMPFGHANQLKLLWLLFDMLLLIKIPRNDEKCLSFKPSVVV